MTATEKELARLAATLTERCLGCAEPVGTLAECGGTRRYGTGTRVDYAAWCALVYRSTSEPLFRVWEEAEPMCGIPSYWPGDNARPDPRRYHAAHMRDCSCGACLPSLADLRAEVDG